MSERYKLVDYETLSPSYTLNIYMQKNLVIVESPAKAKTIEKFLGSDFKVMSSFGHIRDLKKKDFGVDLTTFEPQYEIPADKKQVVSDLRKAAKGAETIWLASDEDREGEAISWHLAEVLKLDPRKAKRIVFHEITKPAILAAIETPRHVDLNLVDAQQARRVLDRLVGFELSPVLWRKVRPSLSAGRVQSVAVRLIVEREREIQQFESKVAYQVTAVFALPDGTSIKAQLHKKQLPTKQEALRFLEECKEAAFEVEHVTKKPGKRSPAAPFTTSTMQQEAVRKMGFPVAMTMRVAQSLYERGLITYMRTDSTNLSGLCMKSCGDVIKSRMGEEYHQPRKYQTKAKGAQEAHEAIRPTNMEVDHITGSSEEQRLYDLIWKRTIACQMAEARLERTVIDIASQGIEHRFVAQGEVLLFDGFLKVYRESTDEDDTQDDAHMLPPMTEGMPLATEHIRAQEKYAAPPARFNEASLVHRMEELGIGRPSTYAPTISTIQQRKYVERTDREAMEREICVLTLAQGTIEESHPMEKYGSEKKKLTPTDTGVVVNDFLTEYFPNIMNYNFTANVEKDFDKVAEGEVDWHTLIKDFYNNLAPVVEKTLNEKTDHRVGERELGTDPKTGRVVSVKIGRYGPMVQIGSKEEEEKPLFSGLKPGQSIQTLTLEEALELFKLPRTLGEFEGYTVKTNAGRFGPYVYHNKVYTSIPKGEDPLDITLERAIELIEAKRVADAQKHIKSFEEQDIEILNGRWGPYIKHKKKNFKIPKDMHDKAAQLTLEECQKFIAEDAKPKRTTKKAATKKSSTTKKKATTSKAATNKKTAQ